MSHASDIEQTAAQWLMRRDACGESADDGGFAAWLAADPRHRAAYLRLAAAWEKSARLKMLVPAGADIDPDLLAGKRRLRWPGGWSMAPAGIAAVVVAAVVIAAVVIAAVIGAGGIAGGIWVSKMRGTQTYQTDVGGFSRVVLQDGSTVTLNTDTKLQVQMSARRREVRLLRGEAQFAVAHDAARPFDVSAADRLVRAVGTAFDVRLNRADVVEVTVTEGRVALIDVGKTEAPAMLGAGESALSEAGKLSIREVSAEEASRHLAWQAGELSFQGETLADAVAEFNRYNRRKIRVADASIAGIQIGGNFHALDVDSFIAALGRSFGVIAHSSDDGTIVLERAPPTRRD